MDQRQPAMMDLRERLLEKATRDVTNAGWPSGCPATPQNFLIVATAYLDFVTGAAEWYAKANDKEGPKA